MTPLPDRFNDLSSADGGTHGVLPDSEIEARIESIQSDLRGYIISLSGHGHDCDDILQETNLFLWDRRADFRPGSNFKAWAFKVAYFKAMANRRDQVRRGEVVFSEDIAQRISCQAETYFGSRPDTVTAMRHCLAKLSTEHLKLVMVKYQQRKPLTSYALQVGKSIDSIHKAISRIRQNLRICIEKELNGNKD